DSVEVEDGDPLNAIVGRGRERGAGAAHVESRVVADGRLGEIAERLDLDGLTFGRDANTRPEHVALPRPTGRGKEQHAPPEERIRERAGAGSPVPSGGSDGAVRRWAEPRREPLDGARRRRWPREGGDQCGTSDETRRTPSARQIRARRSHVES